MKVQINELNNKTKHISQNNNEKIIPPNQQNAIQNKELQTIKTQIKEIDFKANDKYTNIKHIIESKELQDLLTQAIFGKSKQ